MYKYIVKVFNENEIEDGLQKLLDEHSKEGFSLNKLIHINPNAELTCDKWIVILEKSKA